MDGQKKYVVVAPRVMLETMTPTGRMLLGYFAGAPVPDDVPEDQLKHHLESNLIVEVGDPGAVSEVHLTPLEVYDMRNAGENPVDVAADRVREGEKDRNRVRGAQKAAETRRANAEADDGKDAKPEADVKAPVEPVKPVPSSAVVKKPGG